MYTKKTHVHFIGIGGIGMSGIAQILARQGYTVSGCDLDSTQKSTHDLLKLGCTVHQGNDTPACHDATIDVLVYTSAIAQNNPEIQHAKKRGIPVIQRARMLAELMRTKYSIAIAGSHGKTTTSSLIAHILIEANYDPTVIVGGNLININSNVRSGNGDFLVAEADESDRSFLCLQPTLALITNIDFEHPETYRDLEDSKQTFMHFLTTLPFYGKAFLCLDDPVIASLLPSIQGNKITYGIHQDADIHAYDIVFAPTKTEFTLRIYGVSQLRMTLYMPGAHNLLNCLGALAIAHELGVAPKLMQTAITSFKGVERRFWYRGTYKGAEIFDDYAHHPHEIEQVLRIARQRAKGRLIVFFQPHRYTRTYHLWQDFLDVFSRHVIDKLIVTDIYAASEQPIADVCSQRFIAALQAQTPRLPAHYIPCDELFGQLQEACASIAQRDDLVLMLGAGRLTTLAHMLTEASKAK